MKVAIDTNVLVSAALRDKAPERVTLFVVEHPDFDWVVSREILEEYRDVLARPKFGLPADLLQRWYSLLDRVAVVVDVAVSVDFPRDRKDAKFLACAVSAAADYFITGDRDFEHAQKLMKTTILSVALFDKLVCGAWKSQ
ncbi:MAG: putative toxin-antitoxin system toxin component, PIN family [Deltaproteobacteria bacterium]|nr:putative toxin-antitoxin system toxin component, PIN family [Deltaproteobacteria bacterium]